MKKKFLRLLGGLVLSSVVLVVVVYAAVRIADRIGFREIPGEILVTRGVADDRYAEAIERASALIARRRDVIASPAYSVAVGVNDEIVWAEALGWADVSEERPATPETMFRIGSTSKSLTASATARLVEQGVVDLDAPISAYLDMSALPSEWGPLTLRQLHSHTAGLPGYAENGDLRGKIETFRLTRHYEDVVETLGVFDGSDLLYEPGAGFHYSSFDVNLASAVLQAAAGEPFLEVMQSEVFDLLGMNGTAADDLTREIADRATHYERRGRTVKPWRRVDLSIKYAGGGFLSTSTDLVKLGLAYLSGEFLNDETIDSFWTPQPLASGEINEQSYAIGWRSTRVFSDRFDGEVWYVHHGGVSKGAMSWLAIYPELGIVIALNTNAKADTFGDFAEPAAEIVKMFDDVRRVLDRSKTEQAEEQIP